MYDIICEQQEVLISGKVMLNRANVFKTEYLMQKDNIKCREYQKAA
jgi:hypothetical protein